ncbi:MAG: hypothetical protein PHQ48_01325 [Acidobacteriota bacterium]|nr:hypothetical protein [Acidobacteriota bacterium]
MPEKVSLSNKIIRVFSSLFLITSLTALSLIILTELRLGQDQELRSLTGADFLMSRGLLVMILSFFLSLTGLITSSGITKRKRWSWLASLIMAMLLILLFPVGTIFGLKLLLCLFNREVKNWFRSPVSGGETIPPAEKRAYGLNLDLIRQLEEREKLGKK